jgi:predicted deacylase
LPNVQRALCEAAQLKPTGARSVKGRTLWVRDIKPERAAWRVLVVGAIHGDELSSAAVAFHWINERLGAGRDPRAP